VTPEEAGERIESAARAYGPAAAPMIDRILAQVQSESGHEAVNLLIDRHDLELRYNINPIEFESE
jgi:hypothetical protein